MKKFLILAFFIISLTGFTFAQQATNSSSTSKQFKNQIGLDLPFFGWKVTYDGNNIDKVIGFNTGIGISVKNYLGDGAEFRNFNPYISYGTILLLVPYIGFGLDYVLENGFYAGIGVIYIIPEVHFGFYF